MRIAEKLGSLSPVRTILIAGAILTLVFTIVRKLGAVFCEGVLLTAILAAALWCARESIQRWPARFRNLGIVTLILMLAGQLNGRSQDIFPFTCWDMYSVGQEREAVSYVEYFGRRKDGSETRFVADSGGMVDIAARVLYLAKRMNNSALSEDQRQRGRRQFEAYGPLVLDVYNQRHPDAPIESFKIYENRKWLKEHPRVDRVLVITWPPGKEDR
jgi:hypothetical protein